MSHLRPILIPTALHAFAKLRLDLVFQILCSKRHGTGDDQRDETEQSAKNGGDEKSWLSAPNDGREHAQLKTNHKGNEGI